MSEAQWTPGRAMHGPSEWLPALDLPEPGRQRRLTVFFRLLLLIPQLLVVIVLRIAMCLVTIVGWFAALFMGRLPRPLFDFLAGALAYDTRVNASAMLLVDRYPPFAWNPPADHPVRIEVRPTPLNRIAVLFRLILMIPAAIVQGLVMSGWWTLCLIWWLITLVLGEMPRSLFEASAAALRYRIRYDAYAMMLTPAYPKRFFGDQSSVGPNEPVHSATRPLMVGGLGTALLILFLIAGLAGSVASSGSTAYDDGTTYQYDGQGAGTRVSAR